MKSYCDEVKTVKKRLKNKKIHLELHVEDTDIITTVIVIDTKRTISCEYEKVFAYGFFVENMDTYVTEEQFEWLDSQEVSDWLETVGYGQSAYKEG